MIVDLNWPVVVPVMLALALVAACWWAGVNHGRLLVARQQLQDAKAIRAAEVTALDQQRIAELAAGERRANEIDDLRIAQISAAQQDRDDWRARFDRVIEQMNQMRRDGWIVPKKHTQSTPAEEPETVGRRRAEDLLRRRMFVDKAAADFKKKRPDITDNEALRAAEELYSQTVMEDAPV